MFAPGVPQEVACCHCQQQAPLREQKDQAVMMTEDGREVDNPLSMLLYVCPQGHDTQGLFYHDEVYFRVQEQPGFMLY